MKILIEGKKTNFNKNNPKTSKIYEMEIVEFILQKNISNKINLSDEYTLRDVPQQLLLNNTSSIFGSASSNEEEFVRLIKKVQIPEKNLNQDLTERFDIYRCEIQSPLMSLSINPYIFINNNNLYNYEEYFKHLLLPNEDNLNFKHNISTFLEINLLALFREHSIPIFGKNNLLIQKYTNAEILQEIESIYQSFLKVNNLKKNSKEKIDFLNFIGLFCYSVDFTIKNITLKELISIYDCKRIVLDNVVLKTADIEEDILKSEIKLFAERGLKLVINTISNYSEYAINECLDNLSNLGIDPVTFCIAGSKNKEGNFIVKENKVFYKSFCDPNTGEKIPNFHLSLEYLYKFKRLELDFFIQNLGFKSLPNATFGTLLSVLSETAKNNVYTLNRNIIQILELLRILDFFKFSEKQIFHDIHQLSISELIKLKVAKILSSGFSGYMLILDNISIYLSNEEEEFIESYCLKNNIMLLIFEDKFDLKDRISMKEVIPQKINSFRNIEENELLNDPFIRISNKHYRSNNDKLKEEKYTFKNIEKDFCIFKNKLNIIVEDKGINLLPKLLLKKNHEFKNVNLYSINVLTGMQTLKTNFIKDSFVYQLLIELIKNKGNKVYDYQKVEANSDCNLCLGRGFSIIESMFFITCSKCLGSGFNSLFLNNLQLSWFKSDNIFNPTISIEQFLFELEQNGLVNASFENTGIKNENYINYVFKNYGFNLFIKLLKCVNLSHIQIFTPTLSLTRSEQSMFFLICEIVKILYYQETKAFNKKIARIILCNSATCFLSKLEYSKLFNLLKNLINDEDVTVCLNLNANELGLIL